MFYPIQSIGYTWDITKKIYTSLQCKPWVYQVGVSICCAAFLLIAVMKLSFVSAALGILLFWISIIDMYDRVVPDVLLLVSFCFLLYLRIPPNLIVSGLLIGGVLLMKIGLEKLFKKELMGWGDVKLIAVFLVFLPLETVPFFLFICGGLFLITAILTRRNQLPFAPFIVCSFLCAVSFA
ncbi:MAG: prepilin peptidase [Candidatus Paracaedibacteraceae bacterium]|nr:prepilin peptidase [Candidatus Paracaedibacteraceae bacterium]